MKTERQIIRQIKAMVKEIKECKDKHCRICVDTTEWISALKWVLNED